MPRFVGPLSVLFLVACTSTEPVRLSYEGRSTILSQKPAVIDAVVTVRNQGNTVVQVNATQCPQWIAAYSTPERNGEPLWKSGDGLQACAAVAIVKSLAPGDYFDYTLTVTAPASLSGQYVYLAMLGPRGYVPIPIGQMFVQ